nr:MAG TPA: hypothetical protein [Herelleviridae sp.]
MKTFLHFSRSHICKGKGYHIFTLFDTLTNLLC